MSEMNDFKIILFCFLMLIGAVFAMYIMNDGEIFPPKDATHIEVGSVYYKLIDIKVGRIGSAFGSATVILYVEIDGISEAHEVSKRQLSPIFDCKNYIKVYDHYGKWYDTIEIHICEGKWNQIS